MHTQSHVQVKFIVGLAWSADAILEKVGKQIKLVKDAGPVGLNDDRSTAPGSAYVG